MLSLIRLPRVFTVHQVPKAFQEDSIISGYRHPRSSATDCILSLFQLTNETLNIWTHFLPTWYFLWRLVSVVLIQDAWHDAYAWPLLVFLVSCCIYLLASSCAHTFSTMSTSARHICFFFDYGAISFYSLGSAVTYSAYVMPDDWVNSTFHKYYIPIAVFNTIISTAMACYSRFPECPKPKLGQLIRILSFAFPYLFDNIPLFYRVSYFAMLWRNIPLLMLFVFAGEDANPLHYRHIALAFLTVFLCATHLPERLAPGCFDFIGHSHQLFHVSGIIGTLFQMQAIETDMRLRRQWLSEHSAPITFLGTFGAATLCITLSLVVIYLFSLSLLWAPSMKTQQKQKAKGRD